MESGADARARRQAEDRGRGQAEERPGADRHAIERILTTNARRRLGFAPAKINLYLHVGPLGRDGYHPVCSLLTFADVGDEVRLDDGVHGGLSIEGSFGQELDGGPDNLVSRARQAALKAAKAEGGAFGFQLTKTLPLASGVGGGSADAAAALRLAAYRLGLDPGGPAILEAASALGSDVPACLVSRPAVVTGRGEILEAAPGFPALHAVLVNPNVPSPTAQVYRAYDSAPSPQGADRCWPDSMLRTARDMARFLARCRNDLEAPAIRMAPRVGDVLAFLRRQPETLLARMSGSGATCFAIVEKAVDACALEERVSALEQSWWVKRTILAGAP